MKFKALPHYTVRITTPIVKRALGRKYLFFDENGAIETDRPIVVKILTKLSEYPNSAITIETENNAETSDTIKTYHCKHCENVYDNWGDLMAHYRAEHPKNKEGKS